MSNPIYSPKFLALETLTGYPLVGGLLYTFVPGTDTPKTTYTTFACSVAQDNPIVLNSRGEPDDPIFLTGNTDLVLKTDAGVTIWGPLTFSPPVTNDDTVIYTRDYASIADIGARINAAVADATAQEIIISADEWNGQTYSTMVVVDKPVRLKFPGNPDNGVNYLGTEAAIKFVDGSRFAEVRGGLGINLTGNINAANAIKIVAVSDTAFHDPIYIKDPTDDAILIDAVSTGAYQTRFTGLVRFLGLVKNGFHLTSTGTVDTICTVIDQVAVGDQVPAGYAAVKCNEAFGTKTGKLTVNFPAAGAYGFWQVKNHNTVEDLHMDGGAGSGVRVDAGYVTINARNVAAANAADVLWSKYALEQTQTEGGNMKRFINFSNFFDAAVTNYGTPLMYSTDGTGGAVPFSAPGNLIIQPRTTTGTSRGVYYLGESGELVAYIGQTTKKFRSRKGIAVEGLNDQAIQILQLTEELTILAAGSTDSAMNIPANVHVFGVSTRVTTVIPTAANFSVTGAATGTVFSASVSTALGSTDKGITNTPYLNGAAQAIRITPNLVPGAATGKVRITIHYMDITVPTS